MPRRLLLLGFFVVFSAVAVVAHIYIYRRVFRDSQRAEKWKRIGRYGLGMACITLLSAMPLSRILPEVYGRWLSYLGFTWLGFLAISLPIILSLDLLRWLYLRSGQVDEGRRTALSKGLALVASTSAPALAVGSIDQALKAPEIKRVSVPLRHCPPGLKGLKIVQLSDIHFGMMIGREFAEMLVSKVNALDADLIAITGDLVDGTVERLGSSVEVLGQLKSRYGTYFVTGNHEYYSGVEPWMDALTGWGVRVLRNEHISLVRNGEPFHIIGVDDWRARRMAKGHGHDLGRAVAHRDSKVTGILLAHQPKSIHEAAKYDIDLVLSGHTHGGQIWPFKYLVSLVQPYVSGLHQHSARTWIYVHSGTGFWGPPMRHGTEGEIAVVSLA